MSVRALAYGLLLSLLLWAVIMGAVWIAWRVAA